MATTFDIQLPHYSRGFHLITRDIVSQLPALPESGLLVVFIKHTSAGLTINENADPDVRHDFQTFFNKLVPDGAPYFIHTLEGPDDMSAHIKASLIGSSVTIPIKNHRLNLGTWQGVYLGEFRDGGDTRKLSSSTRYIPVSPDKAYGKSPHIPQTGNASSIPVLQEGNRCWSRSGQGHEYQSARDRYYNRRKESSWDETSATPSHISGNLPTRPF